MESLLPELWSAAKTAGPFGVLLLLVILYFVDKERVVHRDARIECLTCMTKALIESTEANTTLAEAIEERNRVFDAIEKAMAKQASEVRKLHRKLDTWLDV